MKYYIKMYNPQTDRTKYKQYKCISGFNSNKERCWKFSKQGATKIIEDLKKEYSVNPHIQFTLEEAEEK